MKKLIAIVLACTALAVGAAAAGKTVTVFIWSEYIDPDLLTRFQKETGMKVVIDTYESTETAMSKVATAGDQYDVIILSNHAIPVMAGKNAFRALDLSKIPNAKNVSPRFVHPAYDPKGTWSLPYQWGTLGLIYRKDKLPKFDATWMSVFDPAKQPGPVVLFDSMRDLMGCALLAKGYSLNTRKPAELKAVGDLLRSARSKRMIGFYGSPDIVGKVLAGDAWVGVAYNGDAASKLDDKTDFVVPREGGIIWVDAMMISAKAPNLEGAYKFVNFILAPDVGAQLSNYIAYATPNEASLKLIDPKARNNPRIYPPEDQMAKMAVLEDVGEATGLYDQIWTRVKAGN
jgi:spermidine/putrescine transport system substrate-binding protein